MPDRKSERSPATQRLWDAYESSHTNSHAVRVQPRDDILRQEAVAQEKAERAKHPHAIENPRYLPPGVRRGNERTFWHLFGPKCDGTGMACPARFGPHTAACRQRSSRSR
jgi:hypothetical protein